MPRPLEFDRDRAVVRAMKLFWSQGYKATSLAALLDTMGIQRSSFYASFGDKRSLFIECLKLFGQRTADLAIQPVDADTRPEQLIHTFFAVTLMNVPEDRLHNGCLLVNSILELADTDDELSKLATQMLGYVEKAFEQALQAARQEGRWHSDLSPRQAAQILMLINQGVRVQSRKRTPREEIWSTLADALALIGLGYLTTQETHTHG
ncbi:MAG: TetR/AcrR family transcriptional regulator [Oceanococcus sp.]|nr:MAG: TetR/AcrR family transcriptional regulator [Oceanococcus sp.]